MTQAIAAGAGGGRYARAPSRAECETLRFRRAIRHSRWVRFLRVALPLTAIAVGGVVVLFTWFNPLRVVFKLPGDVGQLVVSGTKITMEQPRLSGVTKDSRSYELTADAAAQDLMRPDLVELRGLRAVIGARENGSIRMTAPLGIFDRKLETLKLEREVHLLTTTGYECRMQEALIEVRKGTLVSEKPVEVKLIDGTLTANRLEVLDSGQLIRFDGGVVMNLSFKGARPERNANQ
jgi:lipopolysaccharide export system protein LptC